MPYTRVVDETKNKLIYVVTHVDDILVISPFVKERERLEKELCEYFELSPQT
jgi:hypothetical protein